MKSLMAAAAIIAVLAAPAYAQKNRATGNMQEGTITPMQQIEQDRRERLKDADRQYEKRATIPQGSNSYDPWRGVRPSAGEKR